MTIRAQSPIDESTEPDELLSLLSRVDHTGSTSGPALLTGTSAAIAVAMCRPLVSTAC
jgi:hypothetical protein